MKNTVAIVLPLALVGALLPFRLQMAFAEEVSNIPQAEIDEKVYSGAAIIPLLVQHASADGIGTFVGDDTLTDVQHVDIQVQEWWTADPGTNLVRLHKVKNHPDAWTFPTNVPVVFFAITKRQRYGEFADFYLDKAGEDGSELTFGYVDRSWFRVERDNGLIYTFATNLWDCVRANPDPARYYEVLRDAERTVSRSESWRVQLDASKGLSWLFGAAAEEPLAEKLNDPLLSDIMRNSVGNRLRHRFGWTYSYTDGVENWHPPE